MSGNKEQMKTIGIAGLVVLGLVAGFLVATTATGQEYATVGTIDGGDKAFALPLAEDRVRFTLQASQDAPRSQASFALYDPDDRFFGYFQLDGDGDSVDIVADQTGHWVVFVTQATGGQLNVGIASDEDNASLADKMIPIKVRTFEQQVASQDGGPLDAQLALRVDRRPAVASLEHEAVAEDLDATVETDKGPVFKLTDVDANVTENGTAVLSGSQETTPENLLKGTYTVTAQATEFDGTLTFVYKIYDRGQLQTPEHLDRHEEIDRSREALLAQGGLVAELEEGTPVEVSTQGADELLFVTKQHTAARILIYGETDTVVGVVTVGEGDGPRWDWDEDQEEDENNTSEPAPSDTFPLEDGGDYVLVAQEIRGSSDEVLVILPGIHDAKPGRELEVVSASVTFSDDGLTPSQSHEENISIEGGLLDVHVDGFSLLSGERELVIEGDQGVVFQMSSYGGTLGMDFSRERAMHPENFTTGDHLITLESQSIAGEVHVELLSYHR